MCLLSVATDDLQVHHLEAAFASGLGLEVALATEDD